MDEFRPDDEIKPDSSDRRPERLRKTIPAAKVPVSRQYLMMVIGIFVLLLFILAIGSALNSQGIGRGKEDTEHNDGNPAVREEKRAVSSGSSNQDNQRTPHDSGSAVSQASTPAPIGSSQSISMPDIAATSTDVQNTAPAGQKRLELTGDLNSALMSKQEQVNVAAQEVEPLHSTLPTAPATVANGQRTMPSANGPAQQQNSTPQQQNGISRFQEKRVQPQPAAEEKVHRQTSKSVATDKRHTIEKNTSSKGGSYTLQLSSASRSDTLHLWAKKQNLIDYHVYKTMRNGQAWYVLVKGSYATTAEARRAVASLPAALRAQHPWVKPVSLIKKESVK